MPRQVATGRQVATTRTPARDGKTSLFWSGSAGTRVQSGAVNNAPTTTITLSCWAWVPKAAFARLVTVGTSDANAISMMIVGSAAQFGVNVAGSTLNFVSSGVPVGRWAHYTVSVDGTTLRGYVNGVQVGTQTASQYVTLPSGLSAAITAGNKSGGGGDMLSAGGKIDDVRMWNRALSAAEVTALYQNNVVPQNGLVCEWLFDEGTGTTATDTSGNGNNGTITSATYSADAPSKARRQVGAGGSSLAFAGPGTSANVAVANNAAWQFTAGQNFAVSTWFKASAPTTVNGSALVEAWNGSGSYPFVLRLDQNNLLNLKRWDQTNNPAVSYTMTGANAGWHHVVAQKSGSVLQLWLDGVLVATATDTTSGTTTNASPLFFGMRGGQNATVVLGNLKDARIWNRALTADEIANLYKNNVVSRNGLVGEWLFSEGTGSTVADTSGQGNTGTITAATWSTDVPAPVRQTA